MATFDEYLKTHKDLGSFTPTPYYSKDGDSLIFYFKEGDHYAERCDDRLTVYRSFDSKNIVGCQIKGVHCILKKLGSFGFRIQEGDVKLTMIFLGYAATSKPKEDSTVAELSRAAATINAVIPASEFAMAA